MSMDALSSQRSTMNHKKLNFFTKSLDEIKTDGTDYALNEYNLSHRGFFKEYSNSPNKPIVLTKQRYRKDLHVQQLIDLINSLKRVKGVVHPSGLYFYEDEFWTRSENIEWSFYSFLLIDKSNNDMVVCLLKDYGTAMKNLEDHEILPETLLPCNFVVAKENESLSGQIDGVFNPLRDEDSMFYKQFKWFKILLENRRNIRAKFAFCILYCICGKPTKLFQKGFPDVKILIDGLQGKMEPYRIYILYDLLYQMVFKNDFTMTDFFNHLFWSKFEFIMTSLCSWIIALQNNIVWRAYFNMNLSRVIWWSNSKMTPFLFLKMVCSLWKKTNDLDKCKAEVNKLPGFFIHVLKCLRDVHFYNNSPPQITQDLNKYINEIMQYEEKTEDGYVAYNDTFTNEIQYIKIVGAHPYLCQSFNIYCGFKKEVYAKRKITAISSTSHNNDQIKKQKLQPVEGVLVPIGFYNIGSSNMTVYRHFITFSMSMTLGFIQEYDENHTMKTYDVNVKKIIKNYAETFKRILPKRDVMNVLRPDNFCIILKHGKVEGRILLRTEEHDESIEWNQYCTIFTWLQPFLNGPVTQRIHNVKFSFCILYNICQKDITSMTNGFPSLYTFSRFLHNRIKKFRIHSLHRLLYNMIFNQDYTIDDFLSHMFFWKMFEILNLIAHTRSVLKQNISWRNEFISLMNPFSSEWILKITEYEIQNGFLKNQISQDPYGFAIIIRNILTHINDTDYNNLRKRIHEEYLKTNTNRDKGETFACQRYFFEKWPDYQIKIFEFFWNDMNMRKGVLIFKVKIPQR